MIRYFIDIVFIFITKDQHQLTFPVFENFKKVNILIELISDFGKKLKHMR